jgi:hypothetical protein
MLDQISQSVAVSTPNSVCLLAAIPSLSLSVALIGFCIGAFCGLRLRSSDQNVPLIIGLGVAALFYCVAEVLVLLVAVGGVVGVIVLAVSYRSVIAHTLETFARVSGRITRTRRFVQRGSRITDEYFRRRDFLESLPINTKSLDNLLRNEDKSYERALGRLGAYFPYVTDDERQSGDGKFNVEDLFDLE